MLLRSEGWRQGERRSTSREQHSGHLDNLVNVSHMQEHVYFLHSVNEETDLDMCNAFSEIRQFSEPLFVGSCFCSTTSASSDVSTLQLDTRNTWTAQAKELLSTVQHQKFDVVFVFSGQRDGQTFVCKQERAITAQIKNVSVRIPLAVTTHEKSERCSDDRNCIPPGCGSRKRDTEQHKGQGAFWRAVFVVAYKDVKLPAELGTSRGSFSSCELVKTMDKQEQSQTSENGRHDKPQSAL